MSTLVNQDSAANMHITDFENTLDTYLRARFTLIVLITPEEERALQSIKTVCDASRRACLTWDLAEGFQIISLTSVPLPSASDSSNRLRTGRQR